MIFHEIYGCYYHTVAKILEKAMKGALTEQELYRTVMENAFTESQLEIIPSLKNESWQLLDGNLHTPITHLPTTPLTDLQKRWLKAISLDKRMKLFAISFECLEDVEPLFLPEDYVVYDKYNDGDDFDSVTYQQTFRTILSALNQKRKLRIRYLAKKNNQETLVYCIPLRLEYSQKDDKFRLITTGDKQIQTLNLSRIIACDMVDYFQNIHNAAKKKKTRSFTLEVIDERNALERVMLHFAHFEKRGEKLGDKRYSVTVFYDIEDETELVIRVLSFGPFVKVTEPIHFIQIIKERLRMQKSCGLR